MTLHRGVGFLAVLWLAAACAAPAVADEAEDDRAVNRVVAEKSVFMSSDELKALVVAAARCRKLNPKWKQHWVELYRPELPDAPDYQVICWTSEQEKFWGLQEGVDGEIVDRRLLIPGATVIILSKDRLRIIGDHFLRH